MRNEEYNPALKQEIERYLQTGDHDLYYRALPEGGMLHRAQRHCQVSYHPQSGWLAEGPPEGPLG
jgi:hypothetical protein